MGSPAASTTSWLSNGSGGNSPYYQVLNALVDRPEALAADPMLVKRLRRLRASRQKARAARRLGFEVT
jgi:hypothetical protein